MKNNDSKNDDFFNRWAIITGIIQLMDYSLNVKQVDNDTILQHLNMQDRVLENQNKELQKQTNEYLEKIVKQNEEIIRKLNNFER
jgi:hypothetical protein